MKNINISLKIIIVLVVIVSIIAGCNKNEQNKEQPNQEQPNQETNSNDQTEKSGLRILFKDKKWKDEWTTTNENGKDVIITIDADITVPELDSMSVMEIENLPFTGENKEMFLKGLFDENKIFYNDDKYMTKEQWQKKIDREIQDQIDMYEMLMAISSDEDKELINDYHKSLQQLYDTKADYESKMDSAPEEYIKAGNYDGNSYMGYIDGKQYALTFEETEYSSYDSDNNPSGTKREEIIVESTDYIKPDQLENAVNVYNYEASSRQNDEMDGEKNQCEMTKEEAMLYVEKYLNAVGVPNAVCTYIDDLCWEGVKKDKEEPIEYERMTILDGYKMMFSVGINDISLERFGTESSYAMYYENASGSKYNVYSMKTEVTVEVNDFGLISMKVTNPIKIENVIGNVELLPLSDIYKIIEAHMKESADNYGVYGVWAQDKKTFNSMELIYFRMTDRERENHYSYVPVWRLGIGENIVTNRGESKHFREEVILVNAIDGSVINLQDELEAGVSK